MSACVAEESAPGQALQGESVPCPDRLFRRIHQSLALMLEQTNRIDSQQTSPFHLKTAPTLSLELYLLRLARLAKCDPSAFVIALVLLDRFQRLNPCFVVNGRCIHRLLVASLLLAVKGQQDEVYRNKYYAQIGGVSLQELNLMELTLALRLDFDTLVSPEEYSAFLQRLTYN